MPRLWLASMLLLGACTDAVLGEGVAPAWSREQLASLRQWIAAAPQDALPLLDTGALDEASSIWSSAAADRAATALALQLAGAHLHGCANAVERGGWRIPDDTGEAEIEARLREALASAENLDGFFAAFRPQHPEFAALQSAFATEADPGRRMSLARNLERWRWMPRDLGKDYVLVNTAAFEVGLWRGGERVKSWPAVVGKRATPTPVIAATITDVILNPWWEVPSSIVAESGGTLSARKGFVRTPAGRWRQKPGPGNSLGRMKLAMFNRDNIYLHDTPAQSHFARSSRAYSHGCVRVGEALDFAATLLDVKLSRHEVDVLAGVAKPEAPTAALALAALPPEVDETTKTNTLPLPAKLPVYIAYFTAGTRGDGSFALLDDVYGRDMLIGDPTDPKRQCSR